MGFIFLFCFIPFYSSIKYTVNLYQSRMFERVIISKVNCDSALKIRLEKLGVFDGVVVAVIRKALIGGPIQIKVRGTVLALRKVDAEKILVEKYE